MIVDNNTTILVGNTKITEVYQGNNLIYRDTPYTPLNYIKSNNRSYIDTGVVINGIDICFRYTAPYSFENSVFGSRVSNRFGLTTYDNGFHIMPPGYNIIPFDNNKHKLTMGAKFNWIATCDNVSYAVTDRSPIGGTMFLFRENNWYPYYGDQIEIYYCKLYNNNTLVRDFIPVLDPQGIPCLYDLVSETYFYNAGSGQFLYG